MATPNQPRGNVVAEWSFPEFVRHERTRTWYISFFIVDLIFIAIAVLTRNWTFILVIVLASLVLVLRLRRVPPLVRFAIREEGIDVGSHFYGWNELKDFWIVYRPPEAKKVYLHFKNVARPALDISLEDQNPLHVRQLLSEHLLENLELEEEPLADQLSRFFKI